MSNKETIVLGMDPGTRRFGWGVVMRRGTRLVHIAHGVVALGDGPLPLRLAALEKALDDVVAAHTPTHASVETLFFHKDPQAAAKLGHARGVALLICGRAALEKALDEVVRAHTPTHASVETIFFHKDAQAAAKLGHARGVALLVCGRAALEVHEYAPARVKRVVAAHGRADKAQVAQMIRVILSLPAPPASDAADALALAVTHLQNSLAR